MMKTNVEIIKTLLESYDDIMNMYEYSYLNCDISDDSDVINLTLKWKYMTLNILTELYEFKKIIMHDINVNLTDTQFRKDYQDYKETKKEEIENFLCSCSECGVNMYEYRNVCLKCIPIYDNNDHDCMNSHNTYKKEEETCIIEGYTDNDHDCMNSHNTYKKEEETCIIEGYPDNDKLEYFHKYVIDNLEKQKQDISDK
jgi:hypothetical protein